MSDSGKFLDYLRFHGYRSKRHRLLYVATPKAACTSLAWWFAELEGCAQAICQCTDSAETDPDLVIHDAFHRVAPEVTGLPPEALREPLSSEAYFRFAVVRNPYKRIFSAWQSKLLLREPLQSGPYLRCGFFNRPVDSAADVAAAFEGFLEHLAANEAPDSRDAHWTPQAALLRPDLVRYSMLAKMEDARALCAALSARLGPRFSEPFAIRRANESLIPYLPGFLTKRGAELIRELYAADFEEFGYDLQPPEAKAAFSAEQLELALKAVAMIRGRHRRFGEVSALHSKDRALIAEFKRRLAESEDQRRVLESSRSWRYTKPLRALGRRLRAGIKPLLELGH
jgi:hypothetical protein